MTYPQTLSVLNKKKTIKEIISNFAPTILKPYGNTTKLTAAKIFRRHISLLHIYRTIIGLLSVNLLLSTRVLTTLSEE